MKQERREKCLGLLFCQSWCLACSHVDGTGKVFCWWVCNPSLSEYNDFYNNFDGFLNLMSETDVQADDFGGLAWFGGLLSYEVSKHVSLRLEAGFWEDEAHAQEIFASDTTSQEQEIQIVPLLVGGQYSVDVGQTPLRMYIGGYVGAIHIQDRTRSKDNDQCIGYDGIFPTTAVFLGVGG